MKLINARYLELVGPAGPDKEGRRWGFWPGSYWVRKSRTLVAGKGWPQ